jgi:transmembrane sensor
MNDLADEVKRVKDATEVDWSDARAQRVERSMQRRGRRQKVVRRASQLALAAAFVVAAGAWWRVHSTRAVVAIAPATTTEPTPALAATTSFPSVTPKSPDFAVESTPDGLVMHGRGAFTAGDQVVVVRCGDATIRGSNATFEVEREGDRAHVTVVRGHVIVAWSIDSASLEAGDSGSFPKITSAPPKVETQPRWRALALAGSYDSAYVELAKSGPASVRDEPADLFLAADVARLSKHSADAERPLERLVSFFPSDARAPLAAFTLGRVRLEELGHPREAAAAFARARALAPQGPLAEDALAREVESLSRAGDSSAAHDLAVDYLRSYPEGRRTTAVKKFGSVE